MENNNEHWDVENPEKGEYFEVAGYDLKKIEDVRLRLLALVDDPSVGLDLTSELIGASAILMTVSRRKHKKAV